MISIPFLADALGFCLNKCYHLGSSLYCCARFFNDENLLCIKFQYFIKHTYTVVFEGWNLDLQILPVNVGIFSSKPFYTGELKHEISFVVLVWNKILLKCDLFFKSACSFSSFIPSIYKEKIYSRGLRSDLATIILNRSSIAMH